MRYRNIVLLGHIVVLRIRIDAIHCHRPSSVVCRSVWHASKLRPCKNGWTNRDAV